MKKSLLENNKFIPIPFKNSSALNIAFTRALLHFSQIKNKTMRIKNQFYTKYVNSKNYCES